MQFYPLLSLQRCQFNKFVAITCLIFGVCHRHCIFPSWCPFENLDPAALTEGLVPVLAPLRRRHQIVIAAVSDPAVDRLARGREDVGEIYAAAAAEFDAARRTAVAAELRRLGLSVIEAPPDRFAPELADHYLTLKKAGRL